MLQVAIAAVIMLSRTSQCVKVSRRDKKVMGRREGGGDVGAGEVDLKLEL